jgi:rod shape-determining protein MreC
MQRIIALLKHYSNFLYFLVLQALCFIFIIGNNNYQHVKFWNSSNTVVGLLNEMNTNITDYFYLGEANEELIDENGLLKEKLFGADSIAFEQWKTSHDSTRMLKFEYLSARVINSSTKFEKNYLTVDIGTAAGVNPDELMGVVGPKGVVGYTKVGSSTNYTEVVSVLHANFTLGTLHEKSGQFGTMNWLPSNDRYNATILEFPTYTDVYVGDTIVTNGQSGLFPRGELVGTVEKIEPITGKTTNRITVKLATDFNQVHHVHVIRNNQLIQLKKLGEGKENIIKQIQ